MRRLPLIENDYRNFDEHVKVCIRANLFTLITNRE